MRKILVVVDMQKDFISKALGSKEAVAIVDNVVDKIDDFEGEILATLDTHQINYLETNEGVHLPVIHCIEGTEGWMLDDKVQDAFNRKPGTVLKIKKPTFGSVKMVDLLDDIDEKNTEITLVGVCTDICVVSNALLLKAHYPEVKIIVDASCCAGVTPEKHKATLEVMKSCQITVIGE